VSKIGIRELQNSCEFLNTQAINKRRFMVSPITFLRRFFTWFKSVTISGLVVGVLFFIIINFYVFSSIVNLDSFFYAFLLLSLLTDGLFTFIHLPRRPLRTGRQSSDPSKLTIVIASYNGSDVIADTIEGASKHVPLKQIIVVSDASTDDTAEVASKMGVQVIVNERNLHKVRSIDSAMAHVETPYVLILDDDTLIGDTFIPTSLLDEGYTAVAFNVMPVEEKTIINEIQRFEYRATMQLSKRLRASVGAIGNVSGAIGLYRTNDLKKQITLHSGQFAGEDEQRTLLAHMYGEGKGIAYANSLVLTKAPSTYKALFRQRAFSWSLSVPELFVLYLRVILSTSYHYTLKAEKAYQIYIYLTDPLRILFLWTLIMRPSHLIYTYIFYVALSAIVWLRLGARDTLRSVLLTPVYTLGLTLCRFIGYFYWFKVKGRYLAKRMHRPVVGRKLLLEYGLLLSVVVSSWTLSAIHFRNDMHLFDTIRSERLNNNDTQFNYQYASSVSTMQAQQALGDDQVPVLMEPGDNARAIAHKAVDQYTMLHPMYISSTQRWYVDRFIAQSLPTLPTYYPNVVVPVNESLITQSISNAEQAGGQQ